MIFDLETHFQSIFDSKIPTKHLKHIDKPVYDLKQPKKSTKKTKSMQNKIKNY
jgi:hypothetical protein